jgi:hypothetical protein
MHQLYHCFWTRWQQAMDETLYSVNSLLHICFCFAFTHVRCFCSYQCHSFIHLTIYKNFMRIQASALASESWYSSKLLADYMKHDADSNESRYDPISLLGFNYLVCWVGARIGSEPPYYREN